MLEGQSQPRAVWWGEWEEAQETKGINTLTSLPPSLWLTKPMGAMGE